VVAIAVINIKDMGFVLMNYLLVSSIQGEYEKCSMFNFTFLPDPSTFDVSGLNPEYAKWQSGTGPLQNRTHVCPDWDFDHAVFEYTVKEQVS
jgi:hypothetical protein